MFRLPCMTRAYGSSAWLQSSEFIAFHSEKHVEILRAYRILFRLEADRRLEEIAAKRVAREALEAQPITPPNVNMARTAEWAAAQSKPIPTNNPRLAAGHPNANPLQNVYVEDDDLFQVSCYTVSPRIKVNESDLCTRMTGRQRCLERP